MKKNTNKEQSRQQVSYRRGKKNKVQNGAWKGAQQTQQKSNCDLWNASCVFRSAACRNHENQSRKTEAKPRESAREKKFSATIQPQEKIGFHAHDSAKPSATAGFFSVPVCVLSFLVCVFPLSLLRSFTVFADAARLCFGSFTQPPLSSHDFVFWVAPSISLTDVLLRWFLSPLKGWDRSLRTLDRKTHKKKYERAHTNGGRRLVSNTQRASHFPTDTEHPNRTNHGSVKRWVA